MTLASNIKSFKLLVVASVLFLGVLIMGGPITSAVDTITCPDGTVVTVGPGAAGAGTDALCAQAGNSQEPQYVATDCEGESLSEDNCGILRYLVLFINVLSGLAGIAIAAAIIYGGIQYSSAGSDPQKVSAAKNHIRNAIFALLFFIFGYGILNWLVPGGVLR